MINLTNYISTHGRKPRGYGCWIFVNDAGFSRWFTGNYGECKRKAIAALGRPLTLLP